ncbi:hypothetical protein [Fervidibacillus halotolerans]|uniref:Uncharacterized protein n=1 Tax=Fervidibacillus halotolerans TaxID=2980027 RepID=A0A9E8S120_9BACI|nr:hypothetical protein [Fervidibacillus halotolerans]WAA13067.1 hypothetical protein OE105_02765 [Fervidibacillus halotolerans]
MNKFFIDYFFISSLIIIITAFFGNVLQFFGKIFRKKEKRYEYIRVREKNQKNWKRIGGVNK